MAKKPIEIMVDCMGCTEENNCRSVAEKYDCPMPMEAYNNVIILNKPYRAHSCEACLAICDFLEKRSKSYSAVDEERKND